MSFACHKQIQSEEEEAGRVSCGVQIDDVNLNFELGKQMELSAWEWTAAEQKCLWTVAKLFRTSCEPDDCSLQAHFGGTQPCGALSSVNQVFWQPSTLGFIDKVAVELFNGTNKYLLYT